MRIAVAHWGGRISPVFDMTDTLCLIDIEAGKELGRRGRTLTGRDPFQRAVEVAGLGVEVLVCGAVSHVLETALIRAGVQVEGFMCGGVDEIVTSFITSRLADGRHLMPGCRGRRGRFRTRGGRCRWGRND